MASTLTRKILMKMCILEIIEIDALKNSSSDGFICEFCLMKLAVCCKKIEPYFLC